jgi:tetratricopeptide (TPR) repeat protein
VHKLGGTYVVELQAIDLSSDRYRFTVKETATSQDELIGLIDRLSDRARKELQETPVEVAGARIAVGDAVTHSLEAYQHYLRAREIRLRNCDYAAAAKEARRALELDPEMGVAHMELALLLLYLDGDTDESKRHFELSRERTARLPDKERRIVEIDTFMTQTVPVPGDREVHRQTVMRGIDELIARYPQDGYVAYFAGQAHMFFRQWAQALEYYRRSLEMDPGQCYVVGMVLPVLVRLGREEELVPIARRAVEARPNAANLVTLARALRAGEPEEAALRAREAILAAGTGQEGIVTEAACTLSLTGSGGEAARALGGRLPAVLAAIQGRPGEAVRLHDATRGPGSGQPGYLNPRATILAVGRKGNVAPAAAAELRSGPEVILKAGELALYGDLDGASAAAARLQPGSPPEIHYRTVRAAVERRWEEEVPALRGALAALADLDVGKSDARPTWMLEARLLLGQALVEAGEPARAIEVLRPVDIFRSCSFQTAAQSPGMLVARAMAHEKLGRHPEALKDLDRLLALWKDAEPGLPLHAEAKAMRGRLAGHTR